MTDCCPQHGYPMPCNKCDGFTEEEWDDFWKTLAESLGIEVDNGKWRVPLKGIEDTGN